MTADNDPIDTRLAQLKDARRFIIAWGIKMGFEADTTQFLVQDPVLHYAAVTDYRVCVN